jgi:hypothetical protein
MAYIDFNDPVVLKYAATSRCVSCQCDHYVGNGTDWGKVCNECKERDEVELLEFIEIVMKHSENLTKITMRKMEVRQ